MGPQTAVLALQFPGLDVALVVVSVEEVVTVAPVPFEVVVPVVVVSVVVVLVVVELEGLMLCQNMNIACEVRNESMIIIKTPSERPLKDHKAKLTHCNHWIS